MVDHGFGKGTVDSEKPPTVEDIEKIARRLSELDGIIWAHVRFDASGDWRSNHILFEFGHLENTKSKNRGALFKKIRSITEKGHSIRTPIDFWIIKSSYKDGKPAEKP